MAKAQEAQEAQERESLIRKFCDKLEVYCEFYLPKCRDTSIKIETMTRHIGERNSDVLFKKALKNVIGGELENLENIKELLERNLIEILFEHYKIHTSIVVEKITEILENNDYKRLFSDTRPSKHDVLYLQNILKDRINDSIRLSVMFNEIINTINVENLKRIPPDKLIRESIVDLEQKISNLRDGMELISNSLESTYENMDKAIDKKIDNSQKSIIDKIDAVSNNSHNPIIDKIDAISDNLNKIPNDSKIDKLIDLHKKTSDNFTIETEKKGRNPFNIRNITKGVRRIIELDISVTPVPRLDNNYCDINISIHPLSEILDHIKSVFNDVKLRSDYGLQDYTLKSEENREEKI